MPTTTESSALMQVRNVKFSFKNLALLVLMLVSASLGAALRPSINLADERAPIDLETMVPKTFGKWREDPNQIANVVNPQQKSVLDKIYSQTLSRTYVNSQGYRIMLSIAYGKNQSDALKLHKPEICYPAQGFTLNNRQHGVINLRGETISATRLQTSLGTRHEPVTYWTVIGDVVVGSGSQKKIAEIRYALHNQIPDGVLVRVSAIDKDTENAFAIQDSFSSALLNSIAPEHRHRFAGDARLN